MLLRCVPSIFFSNRFILCDFWWICAVFFSSLSFGEFIVRFFLEMNISIFVLSWKIEIQKVTKLLFLGRVSIYLFIYVERIRRCVTVCVLCCAKQFVKLRRKPRIVWIIVELRRKSESIELEKTFQCLLLACLLGWLMCMWESSTKDGHFIACDWNHLCDHIKKCFCSTVN